ncbi:MAG: Re/Si-specific NAD(P)(+) transhydrogenase subunit alpha [Chlorobiota bacterium]
MEIGIVREQAYGERRVALTPEVVQRLCQQGYKVVVQQGAGEGAHYPDASFQSAGAEVVPSAAEVVGRADVLLRLHMPTEAEIAQLREGQVLIGILQAWRYPERLELLRKQNVTCFGLERMPRISRAQSMDVLSSMASLAGYKAVLAAAERFGKLLPMMVTAAGTIPPALVLVIGAGVAGLQAIATARRLGARVEAYDIRPAVKEQVESLGARFLPITLEVDAVEQRGGYARELPEEVQRRQREALATYVARADIVITTAAVPERPAPRLITAEMVERMQPGSVIIDLAAETGGNCELTELGAWKEHNGVAIYGPLNLPATIPTHASQMLARNFEQFLRLLTKDGRPTLHFEDEILRQTCLTHAGQLYPFANETVSTER